MPIQWSMNVRGTQPFDRWLRAALRAGSGWAVVALLLLFQVTATARPAFPTDLPTATTFLRGLQASGGDFVLAILDRKPQEVRFWRRVVGDTAALELNLNGESIGQYTANRLVRLTPRTGVNRLRVTPLNGQPSVEFVFSMVRSAGVQNQLLVLESDPTPAITTVSTADRARILKVVAANSEMAMDAVYRVIQARGAVAVADRPAVANWRSRLGGAGADQGNDQGSDSSNDSAAPPSTTTEAPDSDEAASSEPEETAPSAEPAETEADVSADRRSYF